MILTSTRCGDVEMISGQWKPPSGAIGLVNRLSGDERNRYGYACSSYLKRLATPTSGSSKPAASDDCALPNSAERALSLPPQEEEPRACWPGCSRPGDHEAAFCRRRCNTACVSQLFWGCVRPIDAYQPAAAGCISECPESRRIGAHFGTKVPGGRYRLVRFVGVGEKGTYGTGQGGDVTVTFDKGPTCCAVQVRTRSS
jgi:hypothetical protein